MVNVLNNPKEIEQNEDYTKMNGIKEATEKKKLNYKTKTILSWCLAILTVVIALIFGWYLSERDVNKWELIQDEITLEYGEIIDPVLSEFVDVSEYPNVTNDNTNIKVIATRNGENEYITVGEHKIDIVHQNEYKLFGKTLFKSDDTKTIKLIVRDTVAPVFDTECPKELEFVKDCKEDYTEMFKASDLAEVTITVDDASVDYTKAGEYTANVFATDKNNNVSSQEVKIIIIEPTIELDKTTANLTVGESVNISAVVKGKDQNVTWTSSDEGVATVNNGKITAQNVGTTTIVAKANEVEGIVTVTVKNKTVSSSNNKNTRVYENLSASKPSNNGNSSTSSNEPQPATYATNGCASGNHSMPTGNIGKWFNSKSDLQSYVEDVTKEWREKLANGKITDEEFRANAPCGYEAWSCANCGKWTGNFKHYS